MMKFWCYLCLGLEIWTVSFDSGLGVLSGELVSLLFFLLPIRFRTFEFFFLSSSQFLILRSRLNSLLFAVNSRLNCRRGTTQWWRFDWISESYTKNSIDSPWVACKKRLGFMNCSSISLWMWFWSNWQEREVFLLFMVMCLELNGPLLICTVRSLI